MDKGRKLARRMTLYGLDISIETDKGQYRHWYDPFGKEKGSTKMQYPYGYIRRTEGADGEQIDVYVGPEESSDKVYVIHQLKKPDFKEYDEDKVMMCFSSKREAKQAYLEHYNDPRFYGSMTVMSVEEFKDEYVNKSLNLVKSTMDPIENIQLIQELIGQVRDSKGEDLQSVAKLIWGDGYTPMTSNEDYLRSEVLGFLKDQMELLQMFPAAVEQQ